MDYRCNIAHLVWLLFKLIENFNYRALTLMNHII